MTSLTETSAKPAAKLREDILVSVCFSNLSASEAAFETIRDLARRIDAVFRFREIILVVDDASQKAFLPLVMEVPNLRLFAVRPGNTYYDRRTIAADEAIGDIVLITNVEEIAQLDPLAMIERAAAEDSTVLVTRSRSNPVQRLLSAPVIALGRAAGFLVNPRNLQTIVLPRTQLNQILSHSNAELALRFPPRDPRLRLAFLPIDESMPLRRESGHIRRRLQLVQKLIVYMAPGLLLFVTLASALLTLLGICFGLYIIGAWIIIDDLAPGWLTISAALSMTATFMGISILGLCLGIQYVLNDQRRDSLERVAHEVNRIDLFGQVASDLNIDLDRARGPDAAEGPGLTGC